MVPCFVDAFQAVAVDCVPRHIVVECGEGHFEEILVVLQFDGACVGHSLRQNLVSVEYSFVVYVFAHDA